MTNRKQKTAFTLAEVLITLGIIGIVAAMTLPTLINYYRHKVLETQFKKAYSILWNIHMRMINDYDGVYANFINFDASGSTETPETVKYEYINAFSKYINNGKFCTYKNSYLSCNGKSSPASYKTYDGNKEAHLNYDVVSDRAIVTIDGMTFFFGSVIWRNARIYVDTNGSTKGPNRLGFDLFAFDIDSTDKIVGPKNPVGNSTDDNGNSVATNICSIKYTNTDYNGFGCSTFAIIDQNPDNASLSYWNNLPK